MRNSLLICICILSLACLVHSQTEVWRVKGNLALQDNQGNTYIARGYAQDGAYGAPDTLVKVSPTGDILWKVPVEALYYQLLLSESGIYLTPRRWTTPGAVYHYDANGTLLWRYPLPSSGHMVDLPRVDQVGNIIIAYDSAGTRQPISSKLLKLKPNGERVFEVSIPAITPNAYQQIILGPAIASDGNIWVLAQAAAATEKQQNGRYSYKAFGYEDAMLFNGGTGALLLRKNIFQGLFEQSTDDGKGNTKEYSFNNASYGGPTLFVRSSGNNLVAGGYLDYIANNCRSNRSCKMVQKSEWRMMIVDPAGNVSPFRYRGRGDYRGSDSRTEYRGDDENNILSEILVGTNNILFLHGRIAQGKATNGIGPLRTEDILMRFNASTKKIEWKIVTSFPSSQADITTYFYEPSQNILRQRDNKTIDVYSNAGQLSTTPLVFPDQTFLTPQFDDYSIRNIENGSIILKALNCSTTPCEILIAKYSIAGLLAKQNFTRQVAQYGAESDYQFSLTQNYPNPFNPTTTIEFELAQDALVTVKVYNTLGQAVATPAANEEFGEGINQLEFDGSSLPSGVYYFRIIAQDREGKGILYSGVKKMLLVR